MHLEIFIYNRQKLFQHLLVPSAGVDLKALLVKWRETFPPAFTQWIRELMQSLKV